MEKEIYEESLTTQIRTLEQEIIRVSEAAASHIRKIKNIIRNCKADLVVSKKQSGMDIAAALKKAKMPDEKYLKESMGPLYSAPKQARITGGRRK